MRDFNFRHIDDEPLLSKANCRISGKLLDELKALEPGDVLQITGEDGRLYAIVAGRRTRSPHVSDSGKAVSWWWHIKNQWHIARYIAAQNRLERAWRDKEKAFEHMLYHRDRRLKLLHQRDAPPQGCSETDSHS